MSLRQNCSQKKKRNSSSNKSSTPRSGKRKRRAISPIIVAQASPAPKTKKEKRNLDLSEKVEEVLALDRNILNLPYSDFEDEEEQETNLAYQFQIGKEEFPSPTPKEDQGEPVAEASSNKPRSQKFNQLPRQVYEL